MIEIDTSPVDDYQVELNSFYAEQEAKEQYELKLEVND